LLKSWIAEAKTVQARYLEHLEETTVLKQREVGKQVGQELEAEEN